MASITERRSKSGTLTGFKITVCLGRNALYKQEWRIATIKVDDERISNLTPKKRQQELESIAHELEKQWKEEYQTSPETVKKKPTGYTLNQMLNIWIENNKHQWKPQSILSYRRDTGVILEHFGNRVKAGDINRLRLDEFVIWLKANKKYHFRTIQHIIITFRAAMGYGVAIGAVKSNPLDGFKVKNNEEQAECVDYLTADELAAFIDVVEQEAQRTNTLYWEAFTKVVLFTGIRRGEGLGLKWGDWDREKQKLSIRRNVSHGEQHGTTIVPTKTRQIRTVPVSDGLAAILCRFKEEQAAKYGDSLTADCFMFSSPANPLQSAGVSSPQTFIGRIKKRYAGQIPERCHWHLLRHSFGSLIVAETGNIELVRRLLGHSTIATTSRFYLGTGDDLMKSAVDRYAEIITK